MAEEIGKNMAEQMAQKALEMIQAELGTQFEENAYFFLRSQLTGNFKRFYREQSVLRSAAYDSIVHNQQRQKKKG